MNVNPRREGFVDEQTKQQPEAEAIAPSGGTKRAAPPPEIEPLPEELPPLDQEDEWPIIVQLKYKPIRNNRGEEIKELSLREPRAGDINRYGNPVRFNSAGDIVHDERKMTYMIAALSGVLPPLIEDMHPRDWNTCAYKLQRFSSRSSGLVGSEQDIILDCYRLARWYHVSPEVFLSMTISEVGLHMLRTWECTQAQKAANSDDE